MFGKFLFVLVNTAMAAIAFPDYFYFGLIYSLLILRLFRSGSPKTQSFAQNFRHRLATGSIARGRGHFASTTGAAVMMAENAENSWDDCSINAADDEHFSSSNYSDPFESTIDINPATGLTMMDGIGGIDVGGNLYGCSGSDSWDSGISDIDHSWSSDSIGMDDSWSGSSGMDDW